jgi:redox-sensitive bicupin YhaK (pirin superfamily)
MDLPTDRRLRHTEPGRRPADIQLLRGRDEISQVSQFHIAAITGKHDWEKNKVLVAFHFWADAVGMKTTETNQSVASAPLLVKRQADQRGETDLGWLYSRHTFSFGNYFDPDHMGFRSLRVINDDVVAGGQGFGEHPHRDAEIFSYVIEGELEHSDSMGNGRVIKAGDLQYISAGRGVFHSEFNPSTKNPVHFLQVWLKPRMSGGEPKYAEKALGKDAKPNALTLLFAENPREGAVEIRADADLLFGKLDAGKSITHRSSLEHGQWLHVIEGEISVLGTSLKPGDGAAIEHVDVLEIQSKQGAQFLLFDLA